MNDEQSLLNIYNKMISSDEFEKNKSQEKLVSYLETLKKKLARIGNQLQKKILRPIKLFQ